MMTTKSKSENKQHIQVFSRVRPVSAQELRSQVVVECKSSKEVSVREKNQTKTFNFDRVFGPDSKQIDVYKTVVSPLIEEVLQGYNCTVFAYGQTGTGKTYTMIGEQTNGSMNWEQDPNCGIIPRTLNHIFDELKVRADEFTVRVSFLELYNEELFDLLAPSDIEDGKSLKIFEDSMKKGSVIVSGLEERTVHSKNEVYTILEAGNIRRQTAPTLMNAQSSRSHTIFTITVHIKVTTPEGEDLIKTGKLNLVDLAGSENIGRSGAVDMRAREAGNINQSLLTLGRVITSLVERTPHVPYRESKLTRLLQDSLGGRTKTSIIATVSPALCNIEETLSTFDYAYRARNITNKPEINQKTSKRVLLKEYTEEIERLRKDLIAAREKHGVYLASENYNAIMTERENLNKELVSKLQLLKVREDELIKQEEIMNNLNMSLFATQSELAATFQKLKDAEELCSKREDMFNKLSEQTNVLLKTADEAVSDIKTLHDRLENSRNIQEHNVNLTDKFKAKFCSSLSSMKHKTQQFLEKGTNKVECQSEIQKDLFISSINHQKSLLGVTNQVVNLTRGQVLGTMELLTQQTSSHQNFITQQITALKSTINVNNTNAHNIISNLLAHSKETQIQWENLYKIKDDSQKIVQSQNEKIKEFHFKMSEISKLLISTFKLFENKMKEKEETLKYLRAKYENLKPKQLNLKEKKIELLENFYKELKNNMELEKEINEGLKNTLGEMRAAKEKICSEISQSFEKNIEEVGAFAKDAGNSNKDIENYGIDALEKFQQVTSLINQLSSAQYESATETEEHLKRNLTHLNNHTFHLIQNYENESKKIKEISSDINTKFLETDSIMKEFQQKMEGNIEMEVEKLEKGLNDSLAIKQDLSDIVRSYTEELVLNIMERVKELENLLSNEMKVDEKTGNTPQRKKFSYPKRLICFSSTNGEDILKKEEF